VLEHADIDQANEDPILKKEPPEGGSEKNHDGCVIDNSSIVPSLEGKEYVLRYKNVKRA
jgi:hypothetical protein